MIYRILLFTYFLILYFVEIGLCAKEYNFQEVEMPSESINVIYKDSEGYIWFGSSEGLIKYLGNSHKIYTHVPGDKNTISNNIITSIAEDSHNNLWIGTENGLNLFNRKSGKFKSFFLDTTAYSITDNTIKELFCDQGGDFWVGTSNGLNKLETDNKGNISFTAYFPDISYYKKKKSFSIESLFETKQGEIYIGTWWHGLCLFNKKKGTFESFRYTSPAPDANDNVITSIEEFEPGLLIMSNYNGQFLLFDTNKKKFIQKPKFAQFIHDKKIDNTLKYSIMKDRFNNLWLCSAGGLYIIDPGNLKLLYSTDIYRHGNSYTEIYKDQAYTSLEDNQGIIWVSFHDKGIEKYDPNINKFDAFHVPLKSKLPTRDYITRMIEGNQTLWITTWGDGLIKSDRNGHILRRVIFSEFTGSDRHDIITNICKDILGHFWLGTDDGLIHYDPENNSVMNVYTDDTTSGLVLSHRAIFKMYNNEDGTIWIITQEGTHKLDPLQKEFINNKLVKLANSRKLFGLYTDLDDNYWFAFDEGLMFYDIHEDTSAIYHSNPNNPNSLIGNTVQCIYQDIKKNYWIGTNSGLSVYDKDSHKFKNFYQSEGLASNMVHEIIEDDNYNIWIVVNNGLSKYNPEYQSFTRYDREDGLSDKSDHIFFGTGGYFYLSGEGSFYYFHPDSLQEKNVEAPIYIHTFKLSGREIGINTSPLNGEKIQYKNRIELDYNQNTFGFEFSHLNYSSPEKNRYAYRLVGIDTSWIYLGSRNEVTFQNLYPGKYTFQIKGTGGSNNWNQVPAQIEIMIHPPFWLSVWGYIIYALFIVIILLIYRYITLSREREKNRHELERIKAEKAHELDQMKLSFFFNISHEIRTPLTLIGGPLCQIMSQENRSEIKDKLSLISRNVRRMETIINQILDIRKLEVGKFRPEIIKGNLKKFLDEVFRSFYSFGENSDIKFNVDVNLNHHFYWFSPDSYEKIISNLLVNAFKYTPKKGHISVCCEDMENEKAKATSENLPAKMTLVSKKTEFIANCRYIQIIIQDSGTGMDKSELEMIFERFYQPQQKKGNLQTGFGIGLSLAKDLVEVLRGSIYIDSVPDKGTTFLLLFPVSETAYQDYNLDKTVQHEKFAIREHLPAISQKEQIISEAEKNQVSNDGVNILVVDDNPELLEYMNSILQDNNTIIFAENGEVAHKKAMNNRLDLIISDIMMPVMDGLELCRLIKSDINTSHIPVILLTARSSEEHEIQGFEIGADDYISKPFNPEMLLVRVKNIIENRKKIWEKIAADTKIMPEGLKLSKNDDQLLNKIVCIIEANLSDTSFNQETICREIGLSRTQLYRKLKGLTNQSVNEFIRNVRLKKAAEILRSKKNIHIAELAYIVGFSEPSYFIKMFREKFEMTPRNYNKKYCQIDS